MAARRAQAAYASPMIRSLCRAGLGAGALLNAVACGESGAGISPSEDECGVAGEIVSVDTTQPPFSSVPPPELEPLRDCGRFLGSLHLHVNSAVLPPLEALESLQQIDGSLLLGGSDDWSALSALRTVGGRLIVRGSYMIPVGLEAVERVGGLWLYDGGFTDLGWLRSLNDVTESMIARRNSKISSVVLEELAASRVRPGAWVSLTDSVPPEQPEPDEVLCGEPNTIIWLGQLQQLALTQGAACTRILGSLHLPDISAPEALQVLSSVVEIDGALSVFRNHTSDFSPLRNLRRVGTRFSLNMVQTPSIEGFEGLREVGELDVYNSTDLISFDWLPALRTVRESAVISFSEPLRAEEVTALLSRLEVGGETAVRFSVR
jgi:hypothetical protein